MSGTVTVAPSPRDVVFRDGPAQLYRFRRSEPAGAASQDALLTQDASLTPHRSACPLLLVPSLINRWYVLDLMPGASLVEALVAAGLDVYLLDWGEARDEDRYFSWDDVLARLGRAARRVRREAGAAKVGVLGYCIGGTISGIHAALEPDTTAALVNLAGPFDFAKGGFLSRLTDTRWFDPAAVSAAGNVNPVQMQSGFQLLRPTLAISKWVTFADRATDPEFRASFEAMETWANDNVAFPAAAYERFVSELYQRNELVRGEHRVAGRRVDLKAIQCPVLSVVTSKDAICPPAAARALNAGCGAEDESVLEVPGGHVGAVVGSRAAKELYPPLAQWLLQRLAASPPKGARRAVA